MQKVKAMQKIKKKMILTAVIMLLTLAGCSTDFDAEDYVQATLDQLFQGDVTKAAEFREGTSKADLEAQHTAEIESFVDNNIISGMNVSELMRDDFIAVCEQIFMVMRYEVLDSRKIDRNHYEVTVEIAPMDIFPRFIEGVKADSEEIMQKAKNGEYKGTEEEINLQMQSEFIRHSYELLKTYTEEVSYGEKVKAELNVTADKTNDFYIVNKDLDQLITKILRLDEIQD